MCQVFNLYYHEKVFYSMPVIEKSVQINHSASQMFALVDGVENYPKFLPWCSGSSVVACDENINHATIVISYLHLKHSFTTENIRDIPKSIKMRLLSGPFKHLDGKWSFIPLSDTTCKVEFFLHYTFSNMLLDKLVGPLFFSIVNNFVGAFTSVQKKFIGIDSASIRN